MVINGVRVNFIRELIGVWRLAFSFPEWRGRCLIRVGLALSLSGDTLIYLVSGYQHVMSHICLFFIEK